MTQQIDVNDIVNGLLDQIGQLSKERALLAVQLAALQKEDDDASNTVSDSNDNQRAADTGEATTAS